MAILSSAEKKLVLADIYQYILDNYLYFRHRGPGWRNSIRHNLSLNDCFIKAGRAAKAQQEVLALNETRVAMQHHMTHAREEADRTSRRRLPLERREQTRNPTRQGGVGAGQNKLSQSPVLPLIRK